MIVPQEPTPGQPISATWGRDVCRALRQLQLVGGPGVQVTSGPHGTTISARAVGETNEDSETTVTTEPWSITSISDDGEVSLAHCYYTIGGRFYIFNSSEGAGKAKITVESGDLLALFLTPTNVGLHAPSLDCITLEDLVEESQVLTTYIIPLYSFIDENNAIVVDCDFRHLPIAVMTEDVSDESNA